MSPTPYRFRFPTDEIPQEVADAVREMGQLLFIGPREYMLVVSYKRDFENLQRLRVDWERAGLVEVVSGL